MRRTRNSGPTLLRSPRAVPSSLRRRRWAVVGNAARTWGIRAWQKFRRNASRAPIRRFALPTNKRLAFAAGCAERVVPVHDFDGYADSEGLQRAAELVWRAALGGKVSDATIQKADKAAVEAMPESAEDEPGYNATVLSGVAVRNALDAIRDRTPASAIRVSRGEYDAYEALRNAPEQDWQRRAASLLEGPAGQTLSRNAFDQLGEPPKHLFPELLP
jgi:hypothetical protein